MTMARVIEERESGTQVVTEDDGQVNARLARAIHGDGLHIIRSLNSTDEPSVVLLMELGENDAMYPLCLDDAALFAGWIMESVAAMKGATP
jgi:hypothetical protein